MTMVPIVHKPVRNGTYYKCPVQRDTTHERGLCMENINRSVHCSVEQCLYHCNSCDYCSLDHIRIGTHECDPSREQCTDCLSFARK